MNIRVCCMRRGLLLGFVLTTASHEWESILSVEDGQPMVTTPRRRVRRELALALVVVAVHVWWYREVKP